MTELIISSGSGEIKAGMKMGEWVHKVYFFKNEDGGEVYVDILEAKKRGINWGLEPLFGKRRLLAVPSMSILFLDTTQS